MSHEGGSGIVYHDEEESTNADETADLVDMLDGSEPEEMDQTDDLKAELREVKEELADVEEQVQKLLERQQQLVERREQLEEDIRNAAQTSAADDAFNAKSKLNDFEWSNEVEDLRKNTFLINNFRPLQLQTINTTLAGKDCILIMPTGGGKSLCFHLPALVSKGITLVVSPLVSLMEDQLMALHALGLDAAMLTAASSRAEVKTVHDSMTDKKALLKLLYVTPEKLAKSKRFMSKLEKMYDMGRFARLVIDEVHCCSQWGHDFRPDYKFLGIMRKQFPGVPILGLTATATNNVVADVKKILNIPNTTLYRASFNRHNLYFEVMNKSSSSKDTIDDMHKMIRIRFKGLSGIIYCLSQKDTETVTQELQSRGVKAGCYHAGLDFRQKSYVHSQWVKNEIQVVVATIAFGMGIDKPDVRFVIHHSISKSMENYYQESGRAGRDDQPAHCILYASFGDVFRQSTMVFVEQTGLEKLYNMVHYAFSLSKCRRTLIARHFGEKWDPVNCKQMCDHCDPSYHGDLIKENITSYCKDLLTILRNAKNSDQRVTGLKLLEAWMGKGQASLKVRSVKAPNISRENMERVLMHLLLNDYIREDFHFTAYTTISYLVAGPRAPQTQMQGHVIEMEFPSNKKPQSLPTKTTSSSSANGQSLKKTKSKTQGEKPKVVVISSQGSKFTNMGADTSECSSSKHKPATKRKSAVRIVDSSDDDSDDIAGLDFGDDDENPAPIKKQKSVMQKLEENKPDPIVIDGGGVDDSDDDDFVQEVSYKQ